jgi:phosphoribosylanthranilate isomerase
MVRVKICGVTRPQDVRVIVKEGADAIGFQMTMGPRKITKERAQRLVRLVPPFVTPVGVFVNEPLSKIKALIKFCGFQVVQLHGSETNEFCARIPVPVIKAIGMQKAQSYRTFQGFQVAAFLLDHYNKDKHGGTGEGFNWKWTVQAARQLPAPVLIAGGLTPENVTHAVQTARPFGVDVASGVESQPGLKDPRKVSLFIRRAKKSFQI